MTTARKDLFKRALAAAPGRLHFAAHSHHLWPDASLDGQVEAWNDGVRLADKKWDRVFGEVVPEAQGYVAGELSLPDPETVVFAQNTHDFLIRIVSGMQGRPVRILTTGGEFHAFRRQAERWEESGQAVVTRVAPDPVETLTERYLDAARSGDFDLFVISQVFFRTGQVFDGLEGLADLCRPEGPWGIVDGYHGFMATPTDLSAVADRLFYVTGGYKYVMAGEGAGILHAPHGYCERPEITGWFAEFGNLMGPPEGVRYRGDAGRFWGATFDPTPLYRFNAVRRMLAAEGLTTPVITHHALSRLAQFQGAVRDGQCGLLGTAEIVNPIAGAPANDLPARARFLAIRHPEAQAWRARLLEADIVTDVRDDIIRFGFGLYQDEDDVARLIEGCARVLAD